MQPTCDPTPSPPDPGPRITADHVGQLSPKEYKEFKEFKNPNQNWCNCRSINFKDLPIDWTNSDFPRGRLPELLNSLYSLYSLNSLNSLDSFPASPILSPSSRPPPP